MRLINKALIFTGISVLLIGVCVVILKIKIEELIKEEIPELAGSKGIYMPWPFKSRYVTNAPSDSAIYKLSIGNGRVIETKSLRVIIMDSDGTVMVNYK